MLGVLGCFAFCLVLCEWVCSVSSFSCVFGVLTWFDLRCLVHC